MSWIEKNPLTNYAEFHGEKNYEPLPSETNAFVWFGFVTTLALASV